MARTLWSFLLSKTWDTTKWRLAIWAWPHICSGRVKGDVFYLLQNVFHFVVQGWNSSLGDVCFLRQFVLPVKSLQLFFKCCFFDRVEWLHLFGYIASYAILERDPFHAVMFILALLGKGIANCQEGPSPCLTVVFVPSSENWMGWLCFRWAFRLVVLPLFISTVFKQSHHTSSLTSMGSPLSFSLNQKCSHTKAVECSFETKSIWTYSSKTSGWNYAVDGKKHLLASSNTLSTLHLVHCCYHFVCVRGGAAWARPMVKPQHKEQTREQKQRNQKLQQKVSQ